MNWMVYLSTGIIVVSADTRQAAIKRAIQEEWCRLGKKILYDRMGKIGELSVKFYDCRLRTWFDAQMGYLVDFNDSKCPKV